jgi:uroporphyrinogen decarboxylase
MAAMTPFERVTAVLRHQLPDRVPVFPVLLQQGAAASGMSLENYFTRGECLAEGQLRLLDKFGHDCVFGMPHLVEDITAFGARLMYFDNGPPSAGGMVIHSYADVDHLDTPDPLSSRQLGETLTAIELLRQRVGGDVPILGGCLAPFSLPSMLMGTELWMRLLFLEDPAVREAVFPRLIQITSEFCVRWANLQLEAGADAIILADGMASAAVITRAQFIDLALPVIRATVPRINGPVIHEGVGHLHPMLDLLANVGLAGVMLTCQDNLATAKEQVGDDLALIGNLNNLAMRRWSAADMEEEAQAALEQAAPGGGFILANQGPEIPLGTPEDTIHAMVHTGHAWRY